MATQSSNKAKIARRVIEVLDFFDEDHPEATVMDIVRRFERPQSSTSELLSSLVELGILFKDRESRSYRPTPRAAMLGATTQMPIVRDGRLNTLLDRLAAQTGLTVALFGLVGVDVQIYTCRGARAGDKALAEKVTAGLTERLTRSVAGHLLLATLSRPRREGIVRRLNAESGSEIVPFGEMIETIDGYERKGHAIGDAGFGIDAQVCAKLLPAHATDGPLAIGIIYPQSRQVDADALIGALTDGINQITEEPATGNVVTPLGVAA